jgi:hypothetical protein
MPAEDAVAETSPKPEPRSRLRQVAAVSIAAALVLLLGLFVRSIGRRHDPIVICRELESAGAVAKCAARSDTVEYGVRLPEVAVFELRAEGRKAYTGTLASFRSDHDMRQFLRAAAEDHRQNASKIGAATEIASHGKVKASAVLHDLVPVQIENSERKLAADLAPFYGGPQPLARPAVEALRAAVAR